jgi:hypothetical protein
MLDVSKTLENGSEESSDGQYDTLNRTDLSRVTRSRLQPDGSLCYERTEELSREAYGWSEPGAKGEFKWVHRDLLHLDGRYQRSCGGKEKMARIARFFNWMVCGVLLCVRRLDGKIWVYDGGTRLGASYRRDDTEYLPCLIFDEHDMTKEAVAFLGVNEMHTNVNSYDKQTASVFAKEDVGLKIDELLKKANLVATKKGNGPRQVCCLGILRRCMMSNEAVTVRTVMLLSTLCNDHGLSGDVLRGLFTLQRHFENAENPVDVIGKYGHKLLDHSMQEMAVRIKQYKVETGCTGNRGEAQGLLRLINKGLRYRLVW